MINAKGRALVALLRASCFGLGCVAVASEFSIRNPMCPWRPARGWGKAQLFNFALDGTGRETVIIQIERSTSRSRIAHRAVQLPEEDASGIEPLPECL